jgi:uncharacterized protein (TIGR04255 family)
LNNEIMTSPTSSHAGEAARGGVTIPLNEVAYGVHFVAPEFSVVHFGEYYDTIKDDYGQYQDVPPILKSTGVPNQLELPQLPRVWFIRGSRLLQLQVDRLVYNWRGGLPGHAEGYPGFDTLFPEFQHEWLRFMQFANTAFRIPITLQAMNLAYVNYIDKNENLTTPMFVFQDREWRRNLPELESWSTQYRFSFPAENLRLNVAARPVMRLPALEPSAGLEITLEALTVPNANDADAIFRWFAAAHAKVHWSFRSLVRTEWLAQWGFDARV